MWRTAGEEAGLQLRGGRGVVSPLEDRETSASEGTLEKLRPERESRAPKVTQQDWQLGLLRSSCGSLQHII